MEFQIQLTFVKGFNRSLLHKVRQRDLLMLTLQLTGCLTIDSRRIHKCLCLKKHVSMGIMSFLPRQLINKIEVNLCPCLRFNIKTGLKCLENLKLIAPAQFNSLSIQSPSLPSYVHVLIRLFLVCLRPRNSKSQCQPRVGLGVV